MKIALLGAESTGKSDLALALANALNQRQLQARAVPEYLRQWCDEQGRTPRIDEQMHIAREQRDRIEAAYALSAWVIADTTPLMTAVYSEFVFADTSLYDWAIAYQRSFDLTLLTGLDVKWVADGIQRDGPHVRSRVDALLRQRLEQASLPYQVVYGLQSARVQRALQMLDAIGGSTRDATLSIAESSDSARAEDQFDRQKWQWTCDKCSDPQCEHRLFRALRLGAP